MIRAISGCTLLKIVVVSIVHLEQSLVLLGNKGPVVSNTLAAEMELHVTKNNN